MRQIAEIPKYIQVSTVFYSNTGIEYDIDIDSTINSWLSTFFDVTSVSIATGDKPLKP